MQSPDVFAQLPDGSHFAFWEQPLRFGRVIWVDQNHPDAGDANEGSSDAPLRTINAAAQRARPGEQVMVKAGVYRECVRPVRGGISPTQMISYEAAPDEKVIISGGELLDRARWTPSEGWRRPEDHGETAVWQQRMPREWFIGGNPFATPNRAVVNPTGGFVQAKSRHHDTLMLRCGLVFQDGRRLRQVNDFTQLFDEPGCYWPDPNGLTIHVRPAGDVSPGEAAFEVTARSQCLAPDEPGLGYIRVKGFEIRHAGNQFPFMPQEGALSANRGHHWIVEDCHIHGINSVGMDVGRRDARMDFPEPCGHQIVRRNLIHDCGICGMCGLAMSDGLVQDNLVEDCCWHDVEEMWESAGIKFHRNHNTLVRRNVVRRMRFGCGIWLDFNNRNMRCTCNFVADVHTLFGGIFVEASHYPTRVDHNIIVDSRPVAEKGGGHGVYAHDTDFITIDHNLVTRCAGSAVHLPKGQADRYVGGRGSLSRRHTLAHNLFVACGRYVSFHDTDNTCDCNGYAGCTERGPLRLLGTDEWLDLEAWRLFYGFEENGCDFALDLTVDADSLTLRAGCEDQAPTMPVRVAAPLDWCGDVRDAGAHQPGPFACLGADVFKASIDPRKGATQVRR